MTIPLNATVVVNTKYRLNGKSGQPMPEWVGIVREINPAADRPYGVYFDNKEARDALIWVTEDMLVEVADVDRVVLYQSAIAIRRRGKTRQYGLLCGGERIDRVWFKLMPLIREWRAYVVPYVFGPGFDAECDVRVAEPWSSEFERYAYENEIDEDDPELINGFSTN